MPETDLTADGELKGASWRNHGRGPYIRTYSGRCVFINDPRAEDFTVADIARHLAGINRYTGASRYTVAQHCVVAARMAKMFYPEHEYLPAQMLIHDADEAFIGDVNSPLKSLLPDYRDIEQKHQLAIEEFFGLGFIGNPLVKEVDYRMWLTEREHLSCCGGPATNDYTGPLKPFTRYHVNTEDWFEEWSADEAEASWLESWHYYFPWMVNEQA